MKGIQWMAWLTGCAVLAVSAQAVRPETGPVCEDITPKRGIFAPFREREEDAPVWSRAAQGWYCMHKQNGERPPVPPEMRYLEEHDGYFLGKNPADKVLYLTFDAGYDNGNIGKILDVLHEEQVPGAFFVLEHLVKDNTDLVRRMEAEGHTVCNHTAKHPDMTAMPDREAFAAELGRMEQVYRDTMGKEIARYYRPPEGRISEENLAWAEELGYKTILWSYAYADWDNGNQMNPETAKEKVLAGTHPGEVLLLHPTSATNAAILGSLIRSWKEMGYRFGTLDELTQGGGV